MEKKIETETKVEVVSRPDDSRMVLEQTIAHLRQKSEREKLTDNEVKSLTAAIDTLIKLGREEREIADPIKNLSDDELLKLAKKAMKVLKKTNKKVI